MLENVAIDRLLMHFADLTHNHTPGEPVAELPLFAASVSQGRFSSYWFAGGAAVATIHG